MQLFAEVVLFAAKNGSHGIRSGKLSGAGARPGVELHSEGKDD
jgi:hypothetical protein